MQASKQASERASDTKPLSNPTHGGGQVARPRAGLSCHRPDAGRSLQSTGVRVPDGPSECPARFSVIHFNFRLPSSPPRFRARPAARLPFQVALTLAIARALALTLALARGADAPFFPPR